MEDAIYLAILWRPKRTIIIATFVTLIVVVVGTFRATPVYTASTTLRVVTAPTGSIDWPQYNIQHADQLVSTYAEIVTASPV